MNCQSCGTPAPPGAAFCGNCGNRIDTTISEPPSAAQPPSSSPGWWNGVDSAGAPPPASPPLATPITATPSNEPSLHRKRRWVFAALGVVGLGAAGLIGWLALQSGNIANGGATSPEGVAQGIVDALNHEDLAGASTFVSARELPDLGALVTALQTAAKAQGISGLAQGDGADLTIELKDRPSCELTCTRI